ncbi:MAG: RNA polymerase sigma factor [Thermoflavifilum sp.]|nr:RNA polymerase sigma factor [Thermoflavifilum sp.]
MSASEFQELLTTESAFLMPYAVHLTRDPVLAEDLFQETVCRALVNREKYHPGTNIKAWLYTIMKNIFINEYRRKSKHRVLFDSTATAALSHRFGFSTHNTAESTLRYREIREAIHKLPDIFKRPFLMYFEGYKYEEIADMLKEPLGTIKSRIHFARKILKARISRK